MSAYADASSYYDAGYGVVKYSAPSYASSNGVSFYNTINGYYAASFYGSGAYALHGNGYYTARGGAYYYYSSYKSPSYGISHHYYAQYYVTLNPYTYHTVTTSVRNYAYYNANYSSYNSYSANSVYTYDIAAFYIFNYDYQGPAYGRFNGNYQLGFTSSYYLNGSYGYHSTISY